jgi:hypothetical protein
MKVSLAAHGGWGAGLRRPPLTLDTAALPDGVAAQGMRLAAGAEAADTPDAVAKARAPEAMTYEIVLDYADRAVTLRGSDVAQSPEFAALREWIEQHGR